MKRIWRSIAVVLLLVLLFGCASGTGSNSGTGGTGGTGSPPGGGSDAPVATRERLVIGAGGDIAHWDIHNHNFIFTESVHQNVFDYLVRMNPDTGEFNPDLAVSWELLDPTTWQFKLREGVAFHNGQSLTADDVKFTVERVALDPDLVEHRTMRTIKQVDIIDSHTVNIITHEPDPILLNRLGRIGSGIMPKAYFDEVGLDGWQKSPVGTGPFKFKSWVKDDSVTLVAFDDHWRGAPAVREVVFRVLPEVSSRVAELQAGGIDIALKIGVDNARLIETDADLSVATGLTNRVFYLRVRSQDNYATGDPRVREAIDLAIDRQALIDVVDPGLGVPARSRNIPGISGANPDLYDVNVYDVERAKQLLAEAGYADGLTIGFLARNTGQEAIVSQTVAGMLEKVGITVNLDLVDSAAYNAKLNAVDNPEIYINASGNSPKDSEVAYNFIWEAIDIERLGYSPPDLVALFDQTRSEMDPEKRAKMFHEIAQRVADDRVEIGLYQIGDTHGVRKGISWEPPRDEMIWVYDMKFE